jgi:hypothetical protein
VGIEHLEARWSGGAEIEHEVLGVLLGSEAQVPDELP